ncbi:MAG: haloacid dehalogenase type II [Bacteroidota bacterium]
MAVYRPKALVFDAYGTLFDVSKLATLLATHVQGKALEVNAIWRERQLQYTWLRALMQRYVPFSQVTREALQYACETSGVSLTPSVEEALMQEYLHLEAFPEVPAMLATLSAHNRLAILSNADPAMLSGAVMRNGLQHIFDRVLSADQVETFKPHPSVYALADQQLELTKGDILFVSSNPWDIAGAKAAGLMVCWLNRTQQSPEVLGVQADIEIQALTDLLDLENRSL